ncbi:18930_t:CDS:2, partial [Racocetra fulgida]
DNSVISYEQDNSVISYKQDNSVIPYEQNNLVILDDNSNSASLEENLNTLLREFDIEPQNNEENIWIQINTKLHMTFGYNDYLDYSKITLKNLKFADSFPIVSWVDKIANTFSDDWETKISKYFDDNFEDINNSDNPDNLELKSNKKNDSSGFGIAFTPISFGDNLRFIKDGFKEWKNRDTIIDRMQLEINTPIEHQELPLKARISDRIPLGDNVEFKIVREWIRNCVMKNLNIKKRYESLAQAGATPRDFQMSTKLDFNNFLEKLSQEKYRTFNISQNDIEEFFSEFFKETASNDMEIDD